MEKSKQKDLFEQAPVWQALKAMIIPAVVSQMIVLIYNMADTFYIGQTGNHFMTAGASLILPVFNMILCIANLAGVGGGTLISRLLGAGEEEQARKVSAFSFWLAFGIALGFSTLFALFMNPVLVLLGASEAVMEYACQYSFFVIVLGALPTALSNVMANFMRSIGCSRQASFGIAMGGILNIVLDPVFMFLILPKGMEAAGVGVATLISNCIAFLYFLVMMLKSAQTRTLSFSLKNGLPSRQNIWSVFKVGIPSSITILLFDLDYIVLDKLMASYSEQALAAIGIVLKVERLPLNAGVGICQGMVPLAAWNYGSGNLRRMKDIVIQSLFSGIVFAGICVVIYELFAFEIADIFIANTETSELAASFLRIRILATPLMFMSFFTVHLFQALGQGGKALFLGVVRWLGFNIPMLFLLNSLMQMNGLVWAQSAADLLTVALSLAVLYRFAKTLDFSKKAVLSRL
ncbi:MAG: MATE family efflux transporter [Erysipelotrichaceae bacterium]|nr:MATE family efflux transporter [Erysipelotrichaceae bacterium]